MFFVYLGDTLLYELSNVRQPKLCHTTYLGHQKNRTSHVVSYKHYSLELVQPIFRIH